MLAQMGANLLFPRGGDTFPFRHTPRVQDDTREKAHPHARESSGTCTEDPKTVYGLLFINR